MMKLFILMFLFTSNCFGQLETTEWAKGVGGYSWDLGRGITTDSYKNVIVVGHFESPNITFGNITLTKSSGINRSIFIVKYDSLGNVIWAKNSIGSSYDYAFSVTTDLSDNIILTGSFSSPSFSLGSMTLTNAGQSDIFVLKLNSFGDVVWAKNLGTNYSESAISICTDNFGNVLIAGSFYSPYINKDSVTITNNGAIDALLLKYDENGNLLWGKNIGGIDEDFGTGVSTDNLGNVFFTGRFRSDTIFLESNNLINSGESDVFLIKYDSNANIIWGVKGGGDQSEWSEGIVTDQIGNTFITGWTESLSTSFDSIILNGNSSDIFLTKYDTDGAVTWSRRILGPHNDYSYGISTDIYDNILITGSFTSNTLNFNNSIFISKIGQTSIFIAKYNTMGDILSAKGIGGNAFESGMAICSDLSNNILLTGYFHSPTILFENILLYNNNNTTQTSDIFISKFSNTYTSIKEEDKLEGLISVFPNPTNSIINFTINSADNRTIKQLKISNLLGQEIKLIDIPNEKNVSINVNDFSNGIYIYQITTTNNGTSYGNFIVRR